MSKERYEAKERYVEKRNRENAQVKTLSVEQHNTLAWLCKIRHDIHCSHEKIWIGNWETLKPVDDLSGFSILQERLEENQLPALNIGIDLSTLPQQEDYWDMLSEEEREEYDEFIDLMNIININIEAYLRAIDEKYGTKYCPTGFARLK